MTLDRDADDDGARADRGRARHVRGRDRRGIVRISNTKITGAVRVDHGRARLATRRTSRCSRFGGAGGFVAVDVARELGEPTVIIPPGQGAFSAFGMLMADVAARHRPDRDHAARGGELDAANEVFARMADEAAPGAGRRGLRRARPARSSRRRRCATRARSTRSPCRCHARRRAPEPATIVEQFAQLHHQQYGHSMDDPVEVDDVAAARRRRGRQAARCRSSPRRRQPAATRAGSASDVRAERRRRRLRVYDREQLLARRRDRRARAIIEEPTATTVIHGGDACGRRPRRAGHHVGVSSNRPGSCVANVDPITVEVIRHGLLSSAREMARNLVPHVVQHGRLRDPRLRHRRSTTASGDIVADAPGIAVFTRGNDYGIKRSIEFLGADACSPATCSSSTTRTGRRRTRSTRWCRADPRRRRADRVLVVPRSTCSTWGRRTWATSSTRRDMSRRASSSPAAALPRRRPQRRRLQHHPVQQPDARPHDRRHAGAGVGVSHRRAPRAGARREVRRRDVRAAMEAINDHGERLARSRSASCRRARGAPSTTSTTTASTSTNW